MSIVNMTMKLIGEEGEALVMHNGQLANPNYEWARKMKLPATKKVKTDESRAETAEMEWNGGLYFDDKVGPYLPGANIRRAILDAARLHKDGKSIERGLLKITKINKLEYDGPRTRQKLWANPAFRWEAQVKLTAKSSLVRVRPRFYGWSCECTIDFDSEMLDPKALLQHAETAGRYIGIGDGRPYYAGRFSVEEVTK